MHRFDQAIGDNFRVDLEAAVTDSLLDFRNLACIGNGNACHAAFHAAQLRRCGAERNAGA